MSYTVSIDYRYCGGRTPAFWINFLTGLKDKLNHNLSYNDQAEALVSEGVQYPYSITDEQILIFESEAHFSMFIMKWAS